MLATSFSKEEKQLVGKEVENWLAARLGKACLPASEFEDRKLGVDLWVIRDGGTNTLIPVQITICNDPKIIRRKWCASVSRGIVFIKIRYSQIKKAGERVLEHFWEMVNVAIERAMIFIQKIGEGYQLPLPWFVAGAPVTSFSKNLKGRMN